MLGITLPFMSLSRCLAKELYVHYGPKRARRVGLAENPLQLQLRFLQELGHSNPTRMQLEGLKEDLPPLFKFVAGEKAPCRPWSHQGFLPHAECPEDT
jgi:hypothetical protein